MRRITIYALGFLSLIVTGIQASAQMYYGPGYGADPYYRGYGRPHSRYYAPRGYAGGDLRPRYDPRNGGTYCVDPRFTVQSGVCKPYRGY